MLAVPENNAVMPVSVDEYDTVVIDENKGFLQGAREIPDQHVGAVASLQKDGIAGLKVFVGRCCPVNTKDGGLDDHMSPLCCRGGNAKQQNREN
jgi:hypothetical protein